MKKFLCSGDLIMRRYLVAAYFFILKILAIPRDWVYCSVCGIKYDASWRLYGLPILRKRRGARIIIGKHFKACSLAKWNSIGVFQRVMLKANGSGAKIVIGNNVGMSGCVVSAEKSITIGNNVLIGSGALITDSDAHPIDMASRRLGCGGKVEPIIINDDVFIGARAIILKGVCLGKGCVIGAGSVVACDVPANKIFAGNPARLVGDANIGGEK